MSHEGANLLARVLDGRVKSLTNKPPIMDFGTIQDDMSLKLDKFPPPIPQGDYLVCRSVQLGAIGDILYKTQNTFRVNSGEHRHGPNGGHSHPDAGYSEHSHEIDMLEMRHIHDMLIGPKMRWLQPGDRVLAVWVGDDAVVVDLFLPATRIGRDADGYDK